MPPSTLIAMALVKNAQILPSALHVLYLLNPFTFSFQILDCSGFQRLLSFFSSSLANIFCNVSFLRQQFFPPPLFPGKERGMGTRPGWDARSQEPWPVQEAGLRKVIQQVLFWVGGWRIEINQPRVFHWQGMGRKENPGLEQ